MRHTTTGFTLIEIMVVLALVAVIASFGAAMSLSTFSRSTVVQERDLFVTLLLRGARSAALANKNESWHGIEIDNVSRQYILFDKDEANTRAIPYTSDTITITNTGGDTIVFEPLSGDVSEGAGVITISNGAAEQTITIRNVGQIDW